MNNTYILNECSASANAIPSFIPLAYDVLTKINVKAQEIKKLQATTEKVPLWEKYSLSIDEAAALFGVGEKRIRQLCQDHPHADFYMEVGNHVRIKRRKFMEFLDGLCSV